ncbi:Rho family GTPase 1 like, partial [Silurus meridionalis]
RCKLVLVGDVQCGKTAMLQVLAKDCYPETYVPTVFENYTACLELEDQRVELSLWDTSGPLEEKQAHNITDPPPYFTVGMRCFSAYSSFVLRQTHLECLLPKSSILVSSDQSTRSQLKSQYRLANSRRLRFSTFLFLTSSCFCPRLVSGSPYYDNVRPLCYSDSDAVLLCFDVSRPDTVESGLKKWKTEIMDFCPNTRILLVGCKTDLRTDVCTLMELSNQKQTPITQEQGSAMAKQLGAEAYLECSAFTSEKSIHSVFRTAALACVNKLQPLAKSSPNRRLSKRLLHLPSRSELLSSTFKKEKAKSCSVM